MQPAPATPQALGLGSNPAESGLVSSPFGLSEQEAFRLARRIADTHRHLRARKRRRDLTAEKYLVHIDGEGSGQWADVINGSYIGLPPFVQLGLKLQRNLLRPMVDNMVAYHTAIPFRAVARAPNDKKARDKARVDELHANHVIVTQRLNEMAAGALYMGAAYGHGSIHAVWRDDLTQDPYDPVYNLDLPEGQQEAMQPGFVDLYLGDPWDECYHEGATRWSVQRLTYGRILPADLVRQAFGHIPAALRLEGRTSMPSVSRFQRTVRRWLGDTLGFVHTTSALGGSEGNGEELIALVCEEILPGVDPNQPDGALHVVALNGADETDTRTAGGGVLGRAVLLHRGPLPGKRSSVHRFYTGHRFDDILGAPYVKDLDDLQVQLNQLVTMRVELIRKFARPPLIGQVGIEDVDARTDDDALILTNGQTLPNFAFPPMQGLQFINDAIRETLDEMFRIGGWQAASRGESNPGDPAAKVVALARADDTVFGPANRQFQNSICELLQSCHSLAKTYMAAPTMARLVGEEWGYLVDPWISQSKLSEDLPVFQLVSGFGSTPENKAQQLMGMLSLRDGHGTPVLSTEDFWRMWPDHSLRPPEKSSRRIKETRAQTVNAAIDTAVEKARQVYQQPGQAEQAAPQLHAELGQRFPLLRSDDPIMHIEVLDQIVQDESGDPLARQLARWRQDMYFEWQNQIAMQGAAAQQPPAAPQPGGGGAGQSPASAMRAAGTNNTPGGTTTSESISPQSLAPTVRSLTNEARAM